MTFLPIVQRELRVAARRRSTHRIRFWTALLAIVMSLLAVLIAGVAGGGSVGGPMFNILTGYTFGLCLLGGVLLTADTLSEEKRAGTLGLLFLTDLQGYDVVLGKFLARSLNAFYGLFALLPLVALPLVMGGVTAEEFGRAALALINALFFSLAVGIFVSALMRDSQRALVSTFGLLLIFGGALPALAELGVSPSWLTFEGLSPFYPFFYATEAMYVAHASGFWGTLVASNLLAWSFLVAASLVLPRLWREGTPLSNFRTTLPAFRLPRSAVRISLGRGRLLARNPLLWLTSRDHAPRWGAWVAVLAWVGYTHYYGTSWPGALPFSNWWFWRPYMLFGFLVKVMFALQTCRFFAEGRRNGSLELLLCTPLSNREILRGQAMGLWRSFRWPLLAFVALIFVPIAFDLVGGFSIGYLSQTLDAVQDGGLAGFYFLRFAFDLQALCWVGGWLGLSMKRPNFAPVMTILLVLILPSMICWLDMVADAFLISWARLRLEQDLRWLLAQQNQGLPPLAPPRWPPANLGVPPIIGPLPRASRSTPGS
jgi:ABC-type transport system involved in multi-copper enzyme maturation permease subunit